MQNQKNSEIYKTKSVRAAINYKYPLW